LTWNGVDKDYLFFDDGAVVCWGTSASDHSSLEALLKCANLFSSFFVADFFASS